VSTYCAARQTLTRDPLVPDCLGQAIDSHIRFANSEYAASLDDGLRWRRRRLDVDSFILRTPDLLCAKGCLSNSYAILGRRSTVSSRAHT
jgi:hypothetical protein